MRIRGIAFGFIAFLSFLWIILLCIAIFAQWEFMDRVERSLIIIMMLVDFLTVIMIPFLLIQEFRPWLDAARFLFLFAAHSGIAIFFTSRSSSFQCPSSVPDQQAVCGLIILFVVIASWLVPVLAVGYSCGLAYYVYRLSKMPPVAQEDTESQDAEKQQKTAQHESFQSKSSHRSYVTSYGYAV